MVYYKNNKWRFWEIDFLRGIAIVAMIAFHFIWSLNYFNVIGHLTHLFYWQAFAKITASIFILLVGVSLTLSYSRIRKTDIKRYKKYFLRGLKTFNYGLIVTIVSYLLIRTEFVKFGILHFIGTGIIFAMFFLNFRYMNLILGIISIAIGSVFYQINTHIRWLFWLGLKYPGFSTLDYFPLFPWFGLILIGIFIGNTVYPDGRRRINHREHPNKTENVFCFLGRYSLLIYFIHMIVILGIVYTIKIIPYI